MAPSELADEMIATSPSRRSGSLGMLGVFLAVCLVTLPTTADLGLTWDEPAYRYSQVISARWWRQLSQARSPGDLARVLDPDVLLYHWPYGRHGINFHPPLAGQANLASYGLLGHWLKDIPARRVATALEFALTVALLYGFLARRAGAATALAAAAALVLMPRVYGQAHLIDTDIPGMLLWVATAILTWKAVEEPRGRLAGVGVGILLGLAFLEKMAAVFVLLPTLAWLGWTAVARWRRDRSDRRPALGDACLSLGILLVPLAVVGWELLRLMQELPPPQYTNLFVHRPPSRFPDGALAFPWFLWLLRRLAGRIFPRNPILGRHRPTIETTAAILAWAPLVGWLGNPAWWRESLVRLAHYGSISFNRKGALPDIQILFAGQLYEFSLPWYSAWILIAITVPTTLLLLSSLGLLTWLRRPTADRLKLFCLVNLVTLPLLRILPTPAHDGVRLLLPTFAFLAAFAGWGFAAIEGFLRRRIPGTGRWLGPLLAIALLGPAAWQLVRIHPFELSYYNEAIGGPKRAWERGFELTYWYDAYNAQTLEQLNRALPPGAAVVHANELSTPPTFDELQSLGQLRPDLDLESRSPEFRFRWLLTHDSKASAFTRLLFAMRPWYVLRPDQVQGARLASVTSPEAASRAWALQLLTDGPYTGPPLPPSLPERAAPLSVFEPSFRWAIEDPDGLRRAARQIAANRKLGEDPDQQRLGAILARYDNPSQGRNFLEILLRNRPEAIPEAVDILIRRPDDIRRHLTRYGYIEPRSHPSRPAEPWYLDDEP